MYIFVLVSFIISALFGRMTILNVLFISKKKKLFDAPNSRKVHTKQIPRLGGVSFLPAIFLSLCYTLGLRLVMGHEMSAIFYPEFITEFMFLIAGTLLIYFVGLADDLVGVGYKSKFIIQILAAIFLLIAGLQITDFHSLYGVGELNEYVSWAVTIFIVVGAINSFNLIDGVDGLCSGLSIVAFLTLTVWFFINGYELYAMIGAASLGAVGVFFFFNTQGSRLKVFMGDAGSLVLGYLITFLLLKFVQLSPTSQVLSTTNGLSVCLAIVFVPVFDTVRVLVERITKGLAPFHPDKTHIHHYLLRIGLTHLQSTFTLICIALVLIVINGFCYNINTNILFVINVAYGFIFLIFLPRYFVRKVEGAKGEKLTKGGSTPSVK